MVVVRIIQWIAGIAGLGALALGLLFWIANISFINVHMLLGLTVALLLLLLSIVMIFTRGMRLLGAIGIVYALFVPAFGLNQATLLTGSLHWIIQVAHLLVGLGAVALVGIMGTRYTRLKLADKSVPQITALKQGDKRRTICMHRAFRFGVVTGGTPASSTWITLARRAEELGYATLLMPDRTLTDLAPLTALAVAAQATTTLRVGSYVFCNDFRHPALLAKEVATLDLLSEGRFELGLGAGVGPDNYRQLGLPFESAGTRVSRLEEALLIIKRLFTEESVNFSGKYYTITEMKGVPKPVQKPHPPIFIGSAGKRLLSIAAREADIIAPTSRWSPQGTDPTDAPLEQKVEWIREAAGERFARMELSQSTYYIMITDSHADIVSQAGGPPIPKTPMSIEQTVEHLLEQRERYGFSYIQVYEGQMENFAPVVARLAGK